MNRLPCYCNSLLPEQNGGIIIHGEDKFPTCSSTVLIGLPLALGNFPFTSVCKSLYTTWDCRGPVCARNVRKFIGKNKENMKRINGVQAAFDAFLLRVLQVAFGFAAIFKTSKEAYLRPFQIDLCHHRLASFAEVR